MQTWTRRTPLTSPEAGVRREWWELVEEDQRLVSNPVDVRIGKPLDVVGLKAQSLEDTREYAAFVAKTAARMFGPQATTRLLERCPACDADVDDAPAHLSIHGAAYARCKRCGHVFVQPQPVPEVLNEVFVESEEHASTYTDPASLETRMAQVIAPKIDWMAEVYARHCGGAIGSALDVGAGGGHFVAGLTRRGVAATGYELSKASRRFAREAFDLELRERDFLAEPPDRGRFDVITFWGLLEYTPEPRRFVDRASRWLSRGSGMLVLEIPRIDCFGSAVQRRFPNTVARHLEPTSHCNCFSDASLATLLHDHGFRPVAAWYFGMDVYELFTQLALQAGDETLVGRLAEHIPELQASLDASLACDDLVVAAVPA